MRRNGWQIVVMMALFAIHTPICGLACFESPSVGPTSITEHACHEKTSHSSSHERSGSSNPEDGCGCQLTLHGFVPQSADTNASSSIDHAIDAGNRVDRVQLERGTGLQVAVISDLPPPDVLLLKSTLII
ncbi:MAG TPA: hypothetical protein ENI85_01895 [Deltaproteobacteria bacterium]|nr:hypothetical protein [Deltaproteobacteria bacterium]